MLIPKLRRWLALLVVSLLPACALTEDRIEVRYTPSFSSQQLPAASNVGVEVSSRDDRNTNRHRVGAKKNGYGMEMASIVAANDVVVEVGGIVETTVRNMGFRTGSATDGNVTVELHKLWNDFKVGMWSGQAVTELAATVSVRDATGRVLYSRMHSVEGVVPEIFVMTGANARLAIVQSFDQFAQRLQADREFSQALLDLGRNRPQPAPAPPPSGRAVRPVS